MEKSFLVAILVSIVLHTNAQFVLTYKENGRLDDLKESPLQNGLKVVLPDDSEAKKEARKVLNDKCLKAAEMLSNNDNLVFYREIWPIQVSSGYDPIVQLKRELVAIGNDDITGLPVFRHLDHLITYLPFSGSVYTFTNQNNKVRVVYNNVVNQFLLNYYNSTISMPLNLQVKTLAADTYILYSNFIVDSYNDITAKAAVARKEFSELNRLALENAHNSFRNDPIYSSIISLLRNPWFAQWFWYTEGVLRLHPFEFAGTPFLLKYPEYDALKSSLFNEYVDSLLQRRIRYDSTEKLDEFKKLLTAKQSSHQGFNYLDRIKRMKEENETALKAITSVSSVLNESSFPQEDGVIKPHLYYFADKNEGGTYLEQKESSVIKVAETKSIVVHNVPATAKVFVRESTVSFNDVSEFRKFTDDASGQIASLIPGLKPAMNIVSSFQSLLHPEQHAVATIGRQTGYLDEIVYLHSIDHSGSRVMDIADIKGHLDDLHIFNQDVFDSLKSHNPSFDRLTRRPSIRIHDPAFEELVSIYSNAYSLFYQSTLDAVRQDSIILFHMTNAIINSTLPPGSYQPAAVTKPLYTTFIKKTSSHDDPVTNSVRVVSIESKDSSTLADFKYNVAKVYKFQITAGIAASFPSPVVNTLQQVNGVISIRQKREDVRVIAGINFYFKGLFLQNTSVRLSADRLSFYTGVGIPDPLKNIYGGLCWDVIPSVRILGGVHLHNRTEYEIKNNQLAKTDNIYRPYPFVAIGFDPVSFVKIFNPFQ